VTLAASQTLTNKTLTAPVMTSFTSSARTITIADAKVNASMVLSSTATVTQITSATTGVTCNGPAGLITTFTMTTAAGNFTLFTVSNSYVTATAKVFAQIQQANSTYVTHGMPVINIANVGSGTFDIVVMNLGTTAVSGTLLIGFQVSL
jgi:hypothetical protein